MQILKPPPGGRSQLYAAYKHVDPRPVGTRRLVMLTPDYLTTNQSEVCPLADHALLPEHYKTPHNPLQGGTHSSEGISPLWPPLPGKAIKLFYFTQNSVSTFLFGTGEQKPSFGNKQTSKVWAGVWGPATLGSCYSRT